jgi:hypothetical protein
MPFASGGAIVDWLAAFRRRTIDLPDFTAKVVRIYCSSGHGGGVFEMVKIVRIGFSHFVVGRMVELESWRENGTSNITAWFGINEVSQMYVYDDIEDARKAYYTDGL